MRIVLVIDSWSPGNGGVVAARRMVAELRGRGHDVALVTTKTEHSEEFGGDVFYVKGFYLPGIRESLESMNFKFARGDKKVFRRAFRGADVVHVQFPFFCAANAVRIAPEMDVPVVGACHIQRQNLIGAMGQDKSIAETMINAWFNYELFRRVEAVHCPSAMAADLIKSKGSTAHFRIISNGIPREYVPLADAERPDFFEDHFVLMNVGRFAQEKRQGLMIEAVKRSKHKDHIKLLICGKGEDEDDLKKASADLPVEPQIRYISEEEKLLYLNTADMYLHSSLIELESLSCLEAIGCGLPCLIGNSPDSAASQFALDERLIFEMDDADDMAGKIDYWYEHRDELKNAKKDILVMADRYRMERAVSGMEQLYEDVINYSKGSEDLLPAEESKFA
jgi:glycosyltransferase involved in cell wall biosynthesis